MENEEFRAIRDKEWEKSQQKFIADRDKFEEMRIQSMPKLLKFMGKLSNDEKTIFYRAWWMGFIEGARYMIRLLKASR